MKTNTKRTLRRLWQLIALMLIISLGVLLLRNGLTHYYAAVYPLKYEQAVTAAAQESGLPPSLIYAIIHTESGFNAQAISSANAKGLMQLTDDTFQWALDRAGEENKYTADALYTPDINIRYGVYVLTLLGEQFDNTETVLAAYNAGQGNVNQWLADTRYSTDGKTLNAIPFPETANYITRVRDTQKRYQELYSMQ